MASSRLKPVSQRIEARASDGQMAGDAAGVFISTRNYNWFDYEQAEKVGKNGQHVAEAGRRASAVLTVIEKLEAADFPQMMQA